LLKLVCIRALAPAAGVTACGGVQVGFRARVRAQGKRALGERRPRAAAGTEELGVLERAAGAPRAGRIFEFVHGPAVVNAQALPAVVSALLAAIRDEPHIAEKARPSSGGRSQPSSHGSSGVCTLHAPDLHVSTCFARRYDSQWYGSARRPAAPASVRMCWRAWRQMTPA